MTRTTTTALVASLFLSACDLFGDSADHASDDTGADDTGGDDGGDDGDDDTGGSDDLRPRLRMGNTSPDKAVDFVVLDSSGETVISERVDPLSELPHTPVAAGTYTITMSQDGAEFFRAADLGLTEGNDMTFTAMDNAWGYVKAELAAPESDQFRLNLINYGGNPVDSGWIGAWNGEAYELSHSFEGLAQDVETVQVVDVPSGPLQLELVWNLDGDKNKQFLVDFDIQEVATINAGANAFAYVKVEGNCDLGDVEAGTFDCAIRFVSYNIDGSFTEVTGDYGWLGR